MSDSRKQRLRAYLLHAAIVSLICGVLLPLLQAVSPSVMAAAGLDSVPAFAAAFCGSLLGGGLYTGCLRLYRLSEQEEGRRRTPLERQLHRLDDRVTICFTLIFCLLFFVPIYFVALYEYARER